MKSCCSDSKLAQNLVINDKVVKKMASGINMFLKEKTFEIIGTKPYSLILDETTDSSNKKQLGFIVR